MDDDNYVRLDRLAVAVRQWEDIGAGAKPFDSTSALVDLDFASAGSVTWGSTPPCPLARTKKAEGNRYQYILCATRIGIAPSENLGGRTPGAVLQLR